VGHSTPFSVTVIDYVPAYLQSVVICDAGDVYVKQSPIDNCSTGWLGLNF